MTEWIGQEAIRQIYETEQDRIQQRFSPMFIRRLEGKTPVREADLRTAGERRAQIEAILLEDGAAAGSFREVKQGGTWNALWHLAEALQCGLRADIEAMPLQQETIEICEMFGLNPYYLPSGEDVILAAVRHADQVMEQLKQQNIHAVRIGYTTNDRDRILKQGESGRYLDRPRKVDELQRFQEERMACINGNA